MLEDNGLDTQGGESSVSEQHWTAWINRGLCVQCFPRLRSAGYSWQPKIFCIMIQRDLSMWSVCFNLGMKFQNHVMIRDNTDVNGIFFTGVEYLLSLNLRHFILSQGKWGFWRKVSENWNYNTTSINTIAGWPWKKYFGLNHRCLDVLSMFFLNEECKFVQNSSEWRKCPSLPSVEQVLEKFEKCCLW